jgi:hypothetical protein
MAGLPRRSRVGRNTKSSKSSALNVPHKVYSATRFYVLARVTRHQRCGGLQASREAVFAGRVVKRTRGWTGSAGADAENMEGSPIAIQLIT